MQKANRAAGIGDETGRIPMRIKAEAKMASCTVCQQEMKITKTNTELKQHAENKHGKTLEICFPAAPLIAAEMIKATAPGGGKKNAKPEASGKKGKKVDGGGMDDLLSAGLDGKKKKKSTKKR